MSARETGYHLVMRYLVTARVKPGRAEPLERAIEDGTLGQGSIAGDGAPQTWRTRANCRTDV